MHRDSQPTAAVPARGHFNPERMGALTDGVFAIVLTLLVLELKLPKQDESVLVLLRDNGHVFLAWLISFLALARFWLVRPRRRLRPETRRSCFPREVRVGVVGRPAQQRTLKLRF